MLEVSCAKLADAKNDYELAAAEWAHDKKDLDFIRSRLKEGLIASKSVRDVENDEALSRTKAKVARDRLLVYGLTEAEIADIKNQDGVEKAKMTLRAVADGVLVKRDVVRGNLYDPRDTLLTIVPLDHLWVRGNVDEEDAERIEVGQPLKVIFPFASSGREIAGKVDFIDRTIDAGTRKARFRTTISNPRGRIKAGAYVKVEVQVAAEKRRTEGKESPDPTSRPGGEGSRARGH